MTCFTQPVKLRKGKVKLRAQVGGQKSRDWVAK